MHSRRQAKHPSSVSTNVSNGHQQVHHETTSKDHTKVGSSKRQIILSFLAGAVFTVGTLHLGQGWPRIMSTKMALDTTSSEEERLTLADLEFLGSSSITKSVRLDKSKLSRSVRLSQDKLKKKNKLLLESKNNNKANLKDWKFYDGDVNQYYNELEKDIVRNPHDVNNYAVHRWMGPDHSTQRHYELIYNGILKYTASTYQTNNLKVLDAGCGLGASMMWLEGKQPTWNLVGRTLSEEQAKFITTKLPEHKFRVELRSYDDLDVGVTYDVIYSIEAMIHSPDIHKTMKAWAEHLDPNHGSLILIDDFLMPGFDRDDPEMQVFVKGWMANSFYSVSELHTIARHYGLELVEARDLLSEYRVVELNYKNKAPNLNPEGTKTHQGWIGSKMRHKLTVEGKIAYNMLIFQKRGAKKPQLESLLMMQAQQQSTASGKQLSRGSMQDGESDCDSVPTLQDGQAADFKDIRPKDECISSWYCCDQHQQYLDTLNTSRTHRYGFLEMDPSLFGNYMTAFAKHLNQFYQSIPADYTTGRFLDIGATGSTASGMTQVTTKFMHFAGPLDYWMLDSDQGAKTLNRTVYCDICDCPEADSCGFDVTFSHTVLEHAARPEKAFDTIARLTKKGGITMHLVPWSYQYHATPDDYYRFSHSALRVLMEDRGFEPLEIGYDLCSKPPRVLKERVDEHFDFIWLTYVIARKIS